MKHMHMQWLIVAPRWESWGLHHSQCHVLCVWQDLVEKVMMLRKSIERLRNSEVEVQSPILAEKLTCYAGILAAEGSLSTAMTYLPENSEQVRGNTADLSSKPRLLIWIAISTFLYLCSLSPQSGIMMLRDRLFHAQEEAAVGQQPPNSFNRGDVSTAKPAPAAQTAAPKAQIMVLTLSAKLKIVFARFCPM